MNKATWFDDSDITPPPSASQHHRPRPGTDPSAPAGAPRRQIRVLLVEDASADAALIQQLLHQVEGAEFEVSRVGRLDAAVQQLTADAFHVVLLDLGLPDSQGLNTFTKLHERVPDVPIVVLTGNEDEELAVRAVRAGAQDYLVKGTDVATLVRSMRYAVSRQRGQRRLRRALAEATSSEANLRNLIDQSLDGILVLSPAAQVLFCNAAAATLFGTGAEALLGTRFPAALSETEMELTRPDGRRTAVELRVLALQWKGELANLVLLRDLSERQELQAQRAKLDAAREKQRMILPVAAPSIAGLDVAGESLVAEKVGGDYFDFLETPDALVAVIGDASGHGLASAMLIGETAICIRTLAGVGGNLAEVLQAANRQLCRTAPEDAFVTVLPVRLDLRSRTLEYAGAGHPQGHVLDRLGNVKHVLKSDNLPLGLVAADPFQLQQVTLGPGDLVVLVTDGALEALGPAGTMFGPEGVLDQVRRLRQGSAREIAAGICRAARAFSHPLPQHDDITAVVIKVEP